jgi:phage terminase large subunit-like protein
MTLNSDTSTDGAFWFDESAANRAAQFFPDCLVHVKGDKAGQPLRLHESHQKIVRDLFGWKRADGTRRYRKAYIEIPRKNAKSTLAAGIAIYLLLCDGEQGAEIYSAARDREQAGLVYQMASAMLRKNAMLSKYVTIRDSTKRILHQKSNSFYRVISADAQGAHGFNAHGIIFDEVHTQPNRDLWDTLDTSTGARKQPLTFAITTAGHDRSSICWELHQYARAVMEGHVDDPSFYPVLFSADPDDDWRLESTWRKANPLIGEAVTVDYLREQAKRAEENPAFENTFRRLHLNQWTEQESRIVSMIEWDKCQRAVTPSEYYGRPCFVGLDLSSTRDVTALVLVFPEDDGGYTVFPWFWIPEEAVSQRAGQDQRMIRAFAARGDVETTSGNEVDVQELSERITEICQQFDVQAIGFDPWNATGVTQKLKELGMPDSLLVKMPQSFSTYNEPFKRLLSMLGSGKFRHDGNQVLRWMAANLSHKEDSSGNIRPDKGKSAEKIDGVCATLMGLALATQHAVGVSAYSSTGSGVILF